jgi:hypothetical protein
MKSLYSFLSRVNSESNVKLSVSTATNQSENLLKKFILRSAGIVALLLFFGGSVRGQVSSYTFSESAGTYTPITGGVNYDNFTSWSNTNFLDDNNSAALESIGFNFVYNGTTYTQFGVNANGFISLGSLPTNSYLPLSTGTSNNVISAMGADIIGRGSLLVNITSGSAVITVTGGNISLILVGDKVSGTGIPAGATVLSKTATTVTISANATTNGTGSHFRFSRSTFGIRFQTIGTSPNRTLVVQWTGFQRYTTTGAFGELYNFQIRLNETTNTINIVYNIQGPTSTTAKTYQIGLRGSTNTDYNNRSSTTTWAGTAAGTANTSTLTLSNTVLPSSGRTFSWTPPAPPACAAPSALTSSNITSTSATISWSAASPAPASGYEYFYSTIATAPTAGTTPSGTTAAGVVTANITGLTANTTYYYWVRSNCGGSGTSTWAGSSNFYTGVINTIPFSGSTSVACGTSTLIYDHAGASTDYSINANGYIVLNNNLGSTSVISLTGTYTTELNWDFLRIYNGTGTAGTLIASYSGSGTITPFTSSAGQTITVQFISDNSTNASGISLNAVYSGSCVVPVCSGTPTPGNTISSPSFVAAPSGNVNLSLQNATVGTGVTYQWQSATSQTGTYSNIGATSSTYTATVSSVTWFRCIVTCSGNSGTSAPVQVTLTTCIPTTTYGCTDGDVIARVILNTLDNNSGTGCPSGLAGYSNYTTNPALTTTLLPSSTYNCTVYAGQYPEGYAAWIDYNDDLVFDNSTERIGYSNGQVAGSGFVGVLGSSAIFPITLACTPPAGNHLLRVRAMYLTNGIDVTPCAANFYGEIEDYIITISAAPACPSPGLMTTITTTSSSASLTWAANCASVTSYDFQYGPQGFTLGSGTLVSNQTVTISAPNASYTVTGLQAGTNYDIYYRANCGSSTSAWSLTSNFSTPNSVSAASSTPTLCQGTVLISITHNTEGATGIGTATGLPSGVTAAWSSNIITISGTPAVSGVFSYSIPLTGGFGSVSATGTITVLAAPIAPTATSPQVFCETANATIASLQVSGAAGSTFAWYTAATSGVALSSSTALSIGTTNYFVESIGTNGCVSLTRTSVSVTENPLLSASVSITGTTACPGGVLLFTSTPVNGGTNPTFQWYNNGLVIPNETASTYSASGLLAGDVINVKMIPSGSCVTVCP